MKFKTFVGWPVRVFLINTAAALIPALFSWSVFDHYTWQRALQEMEISFIYAQVIGSLFQFSIPWIWERTNSLHLILRWVLRVSLAIPFCVLGTLIASWITAYFHLAGSDTAWTLFQSSIRLAIVTGLGTTIVASALSELRCRLQKTELQLKTEQLERERALKQVSEARLSSLESRMHPHFLFNTINSVSSLIHDDPERAERLLERMAALLRFSLDAHQNGLVPLDRELRIVSDYLEIEKTRFADRLTYSVDLAPGLSGFSIPPLSVQTVVENSVKYAVAPRREGGRILVTARRSVNRLVIDVWDDGPDFSLSAIPSGHGLDNLKARLATLFGDAAQLELIAQETGKIVRVSLPVTAFAKQTA